MSTVFILILLILCPESGYAQKAEIRPQVIKIVDKLKNAVHFSYAVGYAGRPETNNKYYRAYLKLKAKATNEELVLLTQKGSAWVVVYSFSILQARGYSKLRDVFLEHISDTTFFWTAGGCTGVLDRVNWFMLRRIKPQNDGSDNNCISPEEFDTYCLRFKKEDDLFSCN